MMTMIYVSRPRSVSVWKIETSGVYNVGYKSGVHRRLRLWQALESILVVLGTSLDGSNVAAHV